MSTAELLRNFCEESDDKYSIYENYSGRGMFGKKCIGIVVSNGHSYMNMMMELTRYLDNYADEIDLDTLEGMSVDSLGMDTIVYFPFCQG